MTGKSMSNNHTATSTNAHSDYITATHGTITYTYDTHDNTAGNITWYDTTAGSSKWLNDGWITNETTHPGPALWLPRKCMCCEKNIKKEGDGLVIKLGNAAHFWFHRRCFADKKNARFIRSLIISEDLELL